MTGAHEIKLNRRRTTRIQLQTFYQIFYDGLKTMMTMKGFKREKLKRYKSNLVWFLFFMGCISDAHYLLQLTFNMYA